MIRDTLVRLPWIRLCLLSFALGLSSMISLSLAILLALCVGVLISIWVWFVSRPFRWWYDLVFFASLTCVGVLASVVFAIGCRFLAALSFTTHACHTTSLANLTMMLGLLVLLPGVIFWLMTYIMVLFGSKQR
jgi:hypothetical protein